MHMYIENWCLVQMWYHSKDNVIDTNFTHNVASAPKFDVYYRNMTPYHINAIVHILLS